MIKTVATDWNKIRRVDWAWQDRVPLDMLTTVVGRGGAGKSSLLGLMIAMWSRGGVQGSMHGDPCNSRIIGAEDDFNIKWAPLLRACGADRKRVKLWESDSLGPILIQENADEVEKLIRQQRVRIVVFDAVLNNMGTTTDTHHARQVRMDLSPLQTIAIKTHCAIIICIHTNKRGNNIDQIMQGSTAFRDASRSVLWVTKPRPDCIEERVIFTGKANFAPEGNPLEFRMSRVKIPSPDGPIPVWRPYLEDDESELEMEDVFALMNFNGNGVKRSTKRDSCVDLIRQLLSDGKKHPSVKVVDACKARGFSYRVVLRARDALPVQRTRTHEVPSMEVWSL